MHSTKYIYTFVFIMTALVALVLAGLFTFLKPIHDKNEALYSKRAILSAIESKLDTPLSEFSDEDIQAFFDANIEQQVVDPQGNIVPPNEIAEKAGGATKAEEIDLAAQKEQPADERLLPLYIYSHSDGKQYYIISARGNGLWDAIWGNVALEDDVNTIAGVAFDHQQETPGLGAEIKDNAKWKSQYIGKKFYNSDGELVSIDAVKGGAKDPDHQVDVVSGATITSDGVDDMLTIYMELYRPYLLKIKKS